MRLSCALLTLINDILLKFWVKTEIFWSKTRLVPKFFLNLPQK